MALTADHLIIIGGGRLLATGSVSDFIERSSGHHVHAMTNHVGSRAAGIVTHWATETRLQT